MRVIFTPTGGAATEIATPPDGAEHARVPGACPSCGAAELDVRGEAMRIAADDRAYEAAARARCCDRVIGTLRAEPGTIFGLTEDRAVLHGRPRVY